MIEDTGERLRRITGSSGARNGLLPPGFVPYVWNIGERWRRAQVAAQLRYARERAARNLENMMKTPGE